MTQHIVFVILLCCCVISSAFWVAALLCLRKVLRPSYKKSSEFRPRVSILKPVKGIDAGALENFASFCDQHYSSFEVLFGVADRHDPVIKLIDQLRPQFPRIQIRVFIAKPLGTNPKAAILHRLAAEATGDVLVISDSDIRVTPDFLTQVVHPLADPRVGLVTCLYRGERPSSLSARLEALHMDAAFAPSVAMAWKLGTDVGLGATVVMRRNDLARAGGYAGCADHLLDDYEIAARIARLGLRIHLSEYAVASVLGPMHFKQQWSREVRWSRGIRVSGPARYLGMIITFTLPLACCAAAFSGSWRWAGAVLGLALCVRLSVAWRSAVLLGQRERRYLLWLPLRDFLSLAVWVIGLFGRTVTWRGRQFLLGRDGKLEEMRADGLPNGLMARAVRRLDAFLRRRDGIFEFTDDRQCLLRIHVAPSPDMFEFSAGTHIEAGDPVGVLHLWNEHFSTLSRNGTDLKWAMSLHQAIQHSLKELALAATTDPRLADARAFGANATFVSRNGNAQIARMAARYGFEWVDVQTRPTLFRRIHDFFENFLIFGLQWAFNPAGLRGKTFIRKREPLWITRQKLIEKYGTIHETIDHPEPIAIAT
jgi:ceramide glucosyltransferase